MREDMAQILVERPRRGGGVKYPRCAYRGATDQQPLREPIKSPHVQFRKYLNENLAPLRRFLQSRLGRPWNKIYSEICERINRDSAVQLHIWQHLMWEVARDPVSIERARSYRFFGHRPTFYVDPRSGRLCEMRHEARRRRRPEPFLIDLHGRFFKQINALWFEVELAPLASTAGQVWDAVVSPSERGQHKAVECGALKSIYGRRVYAVGKRQLNKKEIQRLIAELENNSS